MGKLTFRTFVHDQRTPVPPVAHADLTGQTVVVTGGNAGLGFEAAKHFASQKPGRLILACRSEEKGNAAAALIKESTGLETVEAWSLDLATFASVSSFADRFEKDGGRLDILVANAAVSADTLRRTSDGWEESLQVNDLSTALLCLRLAPSLVETAEKFGTKPRVVIVTSEMHFWATIEDNIYGSPSLWQTLNSDEYCSPKLMGGRYLVTKLLVVSIARSLQELLSRTPVIVDTVNPGLCYSGIRRDLKFPIWVFTAILERLLARTTEEGARLLVHAAIGDAENSEALRGAYLNLCHVTEPSDHIVGEDGKRRQEKIWSDLVEELSKVDGRVRAIVSQYS